MVEDKPTEQRYIEDDEITLKELILKLQEFFREALRNWLLIGLITLPFVAYMLYKAYKEPAVYTAKLTFMVNEDEGGSLGGVASILGNFGFGGGAASEYNLEKILQLSRSRKIVQMALFEKATINGQEDFYANHIIKEYDYHEKWEDDITGLKDFLFTHNSLTEFTKTENKALKNLHSKLIGNPENNIEPLVSSSISEETGIMSLEMETTTEGLSIQLLETLYDKLSSFYVEKTIEKQQRTYDIVRSKTDSLLALSNSAQFRLLKFQDSNRGLSLRQYEAQRMQLERDVQVYALAYGESLKNLEVADFSLQSSRPFMQVIDMPIAPIKPKKESKLKALIIGGLLGGFLALAFVIGRKVVRDAMEE